MQAVLFLCMFVTCIVAAVALLVWSAVVGLVFVFLILCLIVFFIYAAP